MKTILCNKCGKKFDMWDTQEDFSIYRNIGFGSVHDGDTLELDLCCECMDKLISECSISPISGKWDDDDWDDMYEEDDDDELERDK